MTQEEKINIAELLKDCEKGMELDCAMYDDITLVGVDDTENTIFPIRVLRKDGCSIALTKYGQYADADYAKCVIFPKGKTTWEGFVPPYSFNDGDIVATTNGLFVGIVEVKNNKPVGAYCSIDYAKDFRINNDYVFDRLATTWEKQKLFDVIKANGYKWNPETKTLDKLIIKQKFKAGDWVGHHKYGKGDITQIFWVDDEIVYEIHFEGLTTYCKANELCKYELPQTKFDINTLKPFDKVLVRDNNEQFWTCDWFSFHDTRQVYPFACVGHYVSQCIPYEKNEHLLGTANDCDEFYKNW